MVRHSALKSISMFVIALLTALFIAVAGGVAVPAGAHDCGCQTDNSGPGSANSGPGNACHDNSGPGSTTSGSGNSGSGNSGSGTSGSNSGPGPNSGPGNGDCPMDDGNDPGNGGDSGDNPGTDPMTDNGGAAGTQAAGTSTVVLGAQASTGSQQSGAQVPTAVSAGLAGSPDSPSALPFAMMLIGVSLMVGALVRRRARG